MYKIHRTKCWLNLSFVLLSVFSIFINVVRFVHLLFHITDLYLRKFHLSRVNTRNSIVKLFSVSSGKLMCLKHMNLSCVMFIKAPLKTTLWRLSCQLDSCCPQRKGEGRNSGKGSEQIPKTNLIIYEPIFWTKVKNS